MGEAHQQNAYSQHHLDDEYFYEGYWLCINHFSIVWILLVLLFQKKAVKKLLNG